MSNNEALIDIINKSRTALKTATDSAASTQKPVEACQSHQGMFALSVALSNGLDTLLMLRAMDYADETHDVEKQDPVTKDSLWNLFAKAIIQDMRTAIITIGVVITILGCAVTYTRQISQASGFVQSTAETIKDFKKN